MYAPHRRSDDDQLRLLKENETADLEAPIIIDTSEDEKVIAALKRSIIVRAINPYSIKPSGLAIAVPKIWKKRGQLKGIAIGQLKGIAIGQEQVQFEFDDEEEMNYILADVPWYVNNWFVACSRWLENPDEMDKALKKLLVWVQVWGIPASLVSERTAKNIVSNIGTPTDEFELHAKNSESREYVRVRTWIPTDEPIRYKLALVTKKGLQFEVSLYYERLKKICLNCKMLTHDHHHCPQKLVKSEQPKATTEVPVSETQPLTSQEPQSSRPSRGRGRGRGIGRGCSNVNPHEEGDSSRSQYLVEKAKGKRAVPGQTWQRKTPVPTAKELKQRAGSLSYQLELQRQQQEEEMDLQGVRRLPSGIMVTESNLKSNEKILNSGIIVSEQSLQPGDKVLSSGKVVAAPSNPSSVSTSSVKKIKSSAE